MILIMIDNNDNNNIDNNICKDGAPSERCQQNDRLRAGARRDPRVQPATQQRQAHTKANIGGPFADRGA